MAERKTERLMNLIFALLVSRQYLTKEQIRQAIADYRESTQQAFERKFERDKEELRELGITVEMGSNDKYFEDEVGYRIRRDEAELPDLALTREEAAVLGLAAQVWEHAGLAGESTTALVKLKAAGVEVDPDVLRMAEPKLSADEPCFDVMWEAATRRIPVAFTYQRPGQEAARRRVQPWGAAHLPTVARAGRGRDHRGARLVRGARGHRHDQGRGGPVPGQAGQPRRAPCPLGPWAVAAPDGERVHARRRRARRDRGALRLGVGPCVGDRLLRQRRRRGVAA
jgi:hypothetical protein